MATLTIRNVPEEVHHALRIRAAENGRSMEAEVRDLLARTVISGRQKKVSPQKSRAAIARLQKMVDEAYRDDRPKDAVSDLIARRRRDAALD
jgi:plasmid stability protein